MTQIFLGYPPEHIKNWIIQHSQENPPTGAERWVKPVHKNEWVFSNGKKFDEEYVIFPDDNGTSLLAMREIYNGDPSDMSDSFYVYADKGCTQQIDNNDYIYPDFFYYNIVELHFNRDGEHVTAYQKYVPGHWEDADGNWINGSWGDWNSVISGYEVEDGEPYGNPGVWYLIGDGQPSAELQKSSNLALWYGDFSGKSNIPFATRTWNNTKPAPENQ